MNTPPLIEGAETVMVVKEPIQGRLIIDGEKVALWLEPNSDALVYLAYALVTQGPGYHILPSVILDDWGNEIGQSGLYPWINDNGLRFPRAEVFGEDLTGSSVQYFLRDLELFAKYPVYVFDTDDSPNSSGKLLNTVLIPDESVQLPQNIEPADTITGLLSKANASWWRVPIQQSSLDFL